jgi:outer membrane receptor protein involved in Fe transport
MLDSRPPALFERWNLRLARRSIVIVSAMLASVAAPAASQRIPFDIAEQPAIAGIPEFGRQAKIQIVSPAGIEGLRTRAVKGRLTVEDGLRRLLRGTNLQLVLRRGNVVSLGAKSAAPPPPVRHVPVRRVAQPPSLVPADIIVTGTASPQRRQDAGLAVTTATLDRIHELAINNTADLLKLAPGIWAETTGGATGANVFVRGFPTTGDAPFLTVQLDGAPIFAPTELAFSENTTLFRVDDMVERVEILRGGTGPIFSNGQPGAVLNFIQRTGTPSMAGGLRVTATDYGTHRTDAYLTGPLFPDTLFAIGGFDRTSPGIRDTQFSADRGGQISANLTHRFAGGALAVYARYTRDRNAFYTGVPLIADDTGGYAAFPGFDPLRDTLIGKDTRHQSIEIGPRQLVPVDLAEGRGLDLLLVGGSLEWHPSSDIQVSERFNLTAGSANTTGLFTGPVPVTLGQYVADTVVRANADPRAVAVAGQATSGRGRLAATGALLSPDRYVLLAGLWSVDKTLDAVTNELRITGTVGSSHRLTGGFYAARYRSDDVRYLGNNLLLLVEPNARRVDVALDNGLQASRDGFVSATTNQIVGGSRGTNLAFFVSDRWDFSDRGSIETGVRLERQWLRGVVKNIQGGVDFDGDPRTLYDNNSSLLLPSASILRDRSDQVSWAVGLVHRSVPDRLTVHARVNRGSNLPSFEKLRIGGRGRQQATIFELGMDVSAGLVRASLNTFANRFDGLQFSRLLAQPDGSVTTIVLQGGAHAEGLELDAEVRPTSRWQIGIRGTLEDGRYKGLGGNDGNRVVRQPRAQVALTPAYSARIGSAAVKLHATYTYVGMRYSDVENLQKLPSYSTVDAGMHVELKSRLYADLVMQNAFNAFGLTEGNTRVLGDAISSGMVIARPLFGRNLSMSLGYRF